MINNIIFKNKLKYACYISFLLIISILFSIININYEEFVNERIQFSNLLLLGNGTYTRSILPILFIFLIYFLENNHSNDIFCLIRNRNRKNFFFKNLFQNILIIGLVYLIIPISWIFTVLIFKLDIVNKYYLEFTIIFRLYLALFLYLIIFLCVFKFFKEFFRNKSIAVIFVLIYYLYTVYRFEQKQFIFKGYQISGITNYLWGVLSIGTNEIFIRTVIYFLIIIVVLTIFTFYIYLNEDIDFEYKNRIK